MLVTIIIIIIILDSRTRHWRRSYCNRRKDSASLTTSCWSLLCFHRLQANSFCFVLHADMLIIRGILLAAWLLPKQPPTRKCLFQGDKESTYKNNDYLSKICKNLMIELTSTSRIFLRPLLTPRWECGGPSPIALPISPSFDIKEAWTLYLGSQIWRRTRFPICLVSAFLINLSFLIKPFLTSKSQTLMFGVWPLKHWAHGLCTSNTTAHFKKVLLPSFRELKKERGPLYSCPQTLKLVLWTVMVGKWTIDNPEGAAVESLLDWLGKFSLYSSFLKLTSIENTMYSSRPLLWGHTVNLHTQVNLET